MSDTIKETTDWHDPFGVSTFEHPHTGEVLKIDTTSSGVIKLPYTIDAAKVMSQQRRLLPHFRAIAEAGKKSTQQD